MPLVNSVIKTFRLALTAFDKKSYTAYSKGYLKSLKAAKSLTQEVDVNAFEKEMTAEIKKALANFKTLEFYTGVSQNPDGAVMLLDYRADGTTPFFIVFKHSVKIVQV